MTIEGNMRVWRTICLPKIVRQVHQRPWTTAHYSWEEMRNHIMSMAISGPTGHCCTVHNNMEWWGDREGGKNEARGRQRDSGRQRWEAELGGVEGLELNPLTFLPSARMPISKPHSHTHWGLRPSIGTWKFNLEHIPERPVTSGHITNQVNITCWAICPGLTF